jgi:hypothetical protein
MAGTLLAIRDSQALPRECFSRTVVEKSGLRQKTAVAPAPRVAMPLRRQ